MPKDIILETAPLFINAASELLEKADCRTPGDLDEVKRLSLEINRLKAGPRNQVFRTILHLQEAEPILHMQMIYALCRDDAIAWQQGFAAQAIIALWQSDDWEAERATLCINALRELQLASPLAIG